MSQGGRGRLADLVVVRRGQLFVVSRRERPQRLRVQVTLLREALARVIHLVLDGEPLADLDVLVGEILLGAVQLAQRETDLVHAGAAVTSGAGARSPPASASFSTRTAAVLNSGCFDTGSHRVIVNSFAARARAFGSLPSG